MRRQALLLGCWHKYRLDLSAKPIRAALQQRIGRQELMQNYRDQLEQLCAELHARARTADAQAGVGRREQQLREIIGALKRLDDGD